MPPVQVVPSPKFIDTTAGLSELAESIRAMGEMMDRRRAIQAERQDSEALAKVVQEGTLIEGLTETQNQTALEDWRVRTEAGETLPPPKRIEFSMRDHTLAGMSTYYGEQEQEAQKNAGPLGFLAALFGQRARPETRTERTIRGMLAADAFAEKKEQTIADFKRDLFVSSGARDRFRAGTATAEDRALAGIRQPAEATSPDDQQEEAMSTVVDFVNKNKGIDGNLDPFNEAEARRLAGRAGKDLITTPGVDAGGNTIKSYSLADPVDPNALPETDVIGEVIETVPPTSVPSQSFFGGTADKIRGLGLAGSTPASQLARGGGAGAVVPSPFGTLTRPLGERNIRGGNILSGPGPRRAPARQPAVAPTPQAVQPPGKTIPGSVGIVPLPVEEQLGPRAEIRDVIANDPVAAVDTFREQVVETGGTEADLKRLLVIFQSGDQAAIEQALVKLGVK